MKTEKLNSESKGSLRRKDSLLSNIFSFFVKCTVRTGSGSTTVTLGRDISTDVAKAVPPTASSDCFRLTEDKWRIRWAFGWEDKVNGFEGLGKE